MKTVFFRNCILLLFLLPSIANCNDTTSDYDKLCLIVTETRKDNEFTKLTPTEQSIELTNKVTKSFPESAQIMSVFSMLASVDPKLKYSLFKEAAEEALSREWDCPSYKEFNEYLIKAQK